MDTTLSNWPNEKFIRDYEPQAINGIVVGILAEYMMYRNITPAAEQREYITRFMIEELKSNKFAFAKPCLIRWALKTYDDPRNNNLSAGVIFEYVKMAYRSNDYSSIIHAYQESQTNQLPEQSISQMNLKAMEDAWQMCVRSVASSKYNLDDWFWVLGVRYLGKVIKYIPEKDIIDTASQGALILTSNRLRKEIDSMTYSGRVDEAKTLLHEMEDTAFSTGDKVTNVRRKLIALDYIGRNIQELAKKYGAVVADEEAITLQCCL